MRLTTAERIRLARIARESGRRGGRKAAASLTPESLTPESLTPEQRRDRARKAAEARWRKLDVPLRALYDPEDPWILDLL